MECYFWCSSGAGVQLYFTLLWRCTKRQLWVESLDHLPNAAPQQNLRWKNKERNTCEEGGANCISASCFSFITAFSQRKQDSYTFFPSFSCTNAAVNSTSLALSSQVPSIGRDLYPCGHPRYTLFGLCEHLSFSHRSKGVQRKKKLWVLQCGFMRGLMRPGQLCSVRWMFEHLVRAPRDQSSQESN